MDRWPNDGTRDGGDDDNEQSGTRKSDCSTWTSFADDDELVVVGRLEDLPVDYSKPYN